MRIELYHTNDLHSNYEMLGRITLEIQEDSITEIENELIQLPECKEQEFAQMLKEKEVFTPDREYTIITDDYLQRGSGYPSLQMPNSASTFYPGFIRDVVEEYLMTEKEYETAKRKRIQ